MSGNVRSAERIFDLLEVLAEQSSPIGVTELAEKTSLSKATVHRLMQTMCDRQYAEKTEDSKYFIGAKIIELASYHIEYLDLHKLAKPYMTILHTTYDLNVYIGKLVRNRIVYSELMGRRTFQTNIELEDLGVPTYPSAVGKCLIAAMSGDEIDLMLYRKPLARYTEKTITDIAEYKQHLKKVRAEGWALNDEEYLVGRRSIGAPIYDYSGAAIACICVNGDMNELADDRIPVISEAVKDCAANISRRMGYVP